MLDFIYYPISAVLWFWHTAFGALLGRDSGIAWSLAVVFLVLTLRALLLKPAFAQSRAQRRIQHIQPLVAALRVTHSHDRRRLATEIRKLNQEHGVNPLLGCLPMLVQVPMFIGLLHVLKSFDRAHARTANYLFGVGDVQSFLHARLLGAPLSATLTAGGDTTLVKIALIAVPVLLLSALATHLTARVSIAAATSTTPQTELTNRLSLWLFPIGGLVTGGFWPIAILVYFATQSVSTLAQQRYLHRTMANADQMSPPRGRSLRRLHSSAVTATGGTR